MKKINNTKAFATISITLALSLGVIIIGGITTFYATANSTDAKIYETNERVSVLESQIATILKGQEKMEEGISDIKNILMK